MSNPWIPIEYAPWDGVRYLLTDRRMVWISSRQHGPMHKDGAPTSGRDFGRPAGADSPTHYAHIPPMPEEG